MYEQDSIKIHHHFKIIHMCKNKNSTVSVQNHSDNTHFTDEAWSYTVNYRYCNTHFIDEAQSNTVNCTHSVTHVQRTPE